jgi:hypothetical protein
MHGQSPVGKAGIYAEAGVPEIPGIGYALAIRAH